MGSLGWAVTLSVLSAASYAAAAVVQERLAKRGNRGLSRWAVALVLTGLGVGLHVVALNFGTVAIVQALGTLTLLFALPISSVRYKQRISAAAWGDALLTVAGLSLIMSLSVESEEPVSVSSTAGHYLSLITIAVVIALVAAASLSGPRPRAILLATGSGVAFGISSVLSKAVMAAFTDGGMRAVSLYLAFMVVLLSVGGYLLSQFSYRGAGLAAPLATVSVSNPIVAATAGIIIFGESFRFGIVGRIVVALAAVVMTLGVIGLSRRTAVTGSSPAESADDSTADHDVVPRAHASGKDAAGVDAPELAAHPLTVDRTAAGRGAATSGVGRRTATSGAGRDLRGPAVPGPRTPADRSAAELDAASWPDGLMPPYAPLPAHESTVAADGHRSSASPTPTAG